MKLLRIGFGNAVVASRVKKIIRLKSAAGRRLRQEANELSRLIDATAGRHTKAVLITDSGHIILSSMTPEVLLNRLKALVGETRRLKKPTRRSTHPRLKKAVSH